MSNYEYANKIKASLESELDKGGMEFLQSERILQTISSVIFQDRKSKNLSQEEYAKIIGISQVMISKIESGNYNPTIEALSKLAYKLNFSLELFFKPSKITFIDNCIKPFSQKFTYPKESVAEIAKQKWKNVKEVEKNEKCIA